MGCCQSKSSDVSSPGESSGGGILASAMSAVGDMADAVGDAVDDVQDAVGDVVEAAGNVASAMMSPFDTFEAKLEVCVVKTLKWIAPKAGNKVSDCMIQQAPMLDSLDYVTDLAEDTVHDHVMEKKDSILDMCQDLLEDIRDGVSPYKALKQAFIRVGVIILRTLKAAVNAAMSILSALVSGCAWCMGSIKDMIDNMFKKVIKMFKKHLKAILNMKAPNFLVSRLPWSWGIDTDIGDEKPKVEQKREQGIQSAKAEKGRPEREPAAEKASLKPPPNKRKGVVVEPDESDTDNEWGDDSDEGESDGYSDYDGEEGSPSDDEVELPEGDDSRV